MAAAAIAAGRLQEVVARHEDVGTSRAKVTSCVSTLQSADGSGEEGDERCELHCVSEVGLVRRSACFSYVDKTCFYTSSYSATLHVERKKNPSRASHTATHIGKSQSWVRSA